MAGDRDAVRSRLGNAHGHRADALLSRQLDGDAHAGVQAVEVEDELGQVLYGIDVVMGRG